MAEQEVLKHTEKVVKLWSKKEHSFWYKLKEFMIEILIIVFAVTVSIWFHERSEHAHQQKEVKEFLLGLKEDLKKDVNEMQEDKMSFENSRKAFKYLSSLKLGKSLNDDSLNVHYRWMFNTTGLVPNNGRFEGFKSSGKIGTIENIELQNDIMDLYQENIPMLILSTDNYTSKKNRLFEYYNMNVKRLTDSTSNYKAVLSSDVVFYSALGLTYIQEINSRYDLCINKIDKIIKGIDLEYKD